MNNKIYNKYDKLKENYLTLLAIIAIIGISIMVFSVVNNSNQIIKNNKPPLESGLAFYQLSKEKFDYCEIICSEKNIENKKNCLKECLE